MQRRPTLLRSSRHRLPAPTSVGDISPQLGPHPPRDQVNEEEAQPSALCQDRVPHRAGPAGHVTRGHGH